MSTLRSRLLRSLLPDGVPPLWCPPLTHYTPEGAIDRPRIAAHLRFMSSWVSGLLVPGTTGDGWELTPAETDQLLGVMLEEAPRLGMHLLWGALHPEAAEAQRRIETGVVALKKQTGAACDKGALEAAHVCGFAVCPPRGARVSEADMESSLSGMLRLGLPLALYQLPQITENEMSPALVARLAGRFPNFILFKDTSGADRVAASGLDLGGVFLVRGMEGGYARWLKAGGGCYDGFLLSSANSFGRQLHEVRELLAGGRREAAQALSDRLSGLIEALFGIVSTASGGNKFANANKLADHFYAHGPRAAALTPPRLHSGPGLSRAMVQATAAALESHRFMPAKGYLE